MHFPAADEGADGKTERSEKHRDRYGFAIEEEHVKAAMEFMYQYEKTLSDRLRLWDSHLLRQPVRLSRLYRNTACTPLLTAGAV
jgi:hypothetical protein